MKKTICILLALGLLTAVALPAAAGGRGGYSGHRGHGGYPGYYGHYHGNGVGGFFAGLVGGAILGAVIANSQEARYAPPPPAYVPPAQVWVPGRYETRYEEDWVPGHWASERVWVPGHYENVRVKVWIPGHWEERG